MGLRYIALKNKCALNVLGVASVLPSCVKGRQHIRAWLSYTCKKYDAILSAIVYAILLSHIVKFVMLFAVATKQLQNFTTKRNRHI